MVDYDVAKENYSGIILPNGRCVYGSKHDLHDTIQIPIAVATIKKIAQLMLFIAYLYYTYKLNKAPFNSCGDCSQCSSVQYNYRQPFPCTTVHHCCDLPVFKEDVWLVQRASFKRQSWTVNYYKLIMCNISKYYYTWLCASTDQVWIARHAFYVIYRNKSNVVFVYSYTTWTETSNVLVSLW